MAKKMYKEPVRRRLKREIGAIKRDRLLYIMVIPGVIFFLLFRYVPMYGITIAFRDYNLFRGFSDAPFIGMKIFNRMFNTVAFNRAFVNTIIISLSKLAWGFPAPIILSLMLNEVGHMKLKKAVQTSLLLPHFMSWVVIGGVLYMILSPNSGIIRDIAELFGKGESVVNVMGDKRYFRTFLVVSEIWKGMGYGTIVYLAAIAGIDQELYEAARCDGASKPAQIWHVTLASIRPMIVLMLILRVGHILGAGFEQIFVLSNPLVVEVADIVDTYVYRIGVEQANYSLGTAAGLFKSVIGLIMVLGANYVAKKIDEDSGLI
ncbi:MAG: ABC transporter permease subunit [Clostridiales bacterium]|nr:ABC transporter permease subunit [Clostridiales bacterium]